MTHEVWHRFGADPLSAALIDCDKGERGRVEEIVKAILEEGNYIENRNAYDLKTLQHAYRHCILEMDPELSNTSIDEFE